VNIGDYLLKQNIITKKQREKAELEHEVSGNKFGKCCLDLGFITRTELNQALKAIQKYQTGEKKTMAATEIGENSKFTFDLKFLITMGTVIVSACGTYFSITGQIEELSSKNSPNRLEHNHLAEELEEIKEMGDLKIISYKLEQYDETFDELKSLSTSLQPLASDLVYIKEELNELKNKKIEIPEVDLSGVEECQKNMEALKVEIEELKKLEQRLIKVEKNIGSKF
jgi:DNA repair exonuclease SbcCD ATPase subunit